METSSKRNAAIPVSSSTTPDLVYHYTTANTFRRIIEGKSLRFGHVRPQNDRQEVTYFQDLAYDYLRSEMQKSSERRAELQPLCTPLLFDIRTPMATRDDIPDGYRSYIVCFSEEGDLKSQWNHYADNFRGLAIGFRPSQFIGCGFERLDNSFGNSIGLFEHVSYDDPETLKLELFPTLARDVGAWLIGVFVLQHLHKAPEWHEEREWRLYYSPSSMAAPINTQEELIQSHVFWQDNQPTRYSGLQRLPFLRFDSAAVARVVMGPHCELNESEIEDVLTGSGVAATVTRSALQIRQ